MSLTCNLADSLRQTTGIAALPGGAASCVAHKKTPPRLFRSVIVFRPFTASDYPALQVSGARIAPAYQDNRKVAWPIRLLICELRLVISPNVESSEFISGA